MNCRSLLKENPCEPICPLLTGWFENDFVSCEYHDCYGRELAVWYCKSVQLTPYAKEIQPNPVEKRHIHLPLDKGSLYLPFYPATFYHGLELWRLLGWSLTTGDALFCLTNLYGGMIESALVHTELHHPQEMSQLPGVAVTPSTQISSLRSTWNIETFDKDDDKKYSTLCICCLGLCNDDGTRKYREEDLQEINFRLGQYLDSLAIGGTLVIAWIPEKNDTHESLWALLAPRFDSFQWIRPSFANHHDPRAFLVMTGKRDSDRKKFGKRARILRESCANVEYLDYVESHDWLRIMNLPGGEMMWELDNNYRSSLLPVSLTPIEDWDSRMKLPETMAKMKIDLRHYKRCLDARPSKIMDDKYSGLTENIFFTWENAVRCLESKYSLIRLIQKKYGGEIVTNAWLKMHEILHQTEILQGVNHVRGMHLCEAPGAFVSAVNHYVKTHGGKYDWRAQTLLAARNNTALGDHYQLSENYPSNWFQTGVLEMCNGDITDPECINYYIKECKRQNFHPNFMTGDGGIRMNSQRLVEQELQMQYLFLGQFVTCCQILSQGGSFVLKMFLPCVERGSLMVIAGMSQCFDNVRIVKPVCSSSFNSEVYLVAQGFHENNVDDQMVDMCFRALREKSLDHLPLPPQTFLEELEQTLLPFVESQKDSLRVAISWMQLPPSVAPNVGSSLTLKEMGVLMLAREDSLTRD